MPTTVEYRVSLAHRTRHLYEVEARFPSSIARDGAVELRLPTWTPGSYLVREYARHVQDVSAHDERDRPLAVEKSDKASWRVQVGDGREVVLRYFVYAHELSVRTSHLDDSHAYWNGACLFVYADALRDAPLRITVTDFPPGWQVSTGLASEPDRPHVLTAADYDEVIDSPVEIGAHERLRFEVEGKQHELAVWGASEIDRDRLVDEMKQIVAKQAELMGGVPYERYVFILLFTPGGYGGLEHRNSCALVANSHAHHQKNKYLDFLELISHEFFHLWNIKRIHPETLGPFDYQREAHTKSLWVAEGWTSYYDRLTLRRAGLMPTERYLEKLGEELTKLNGIPGRKHHSLEQSSWDAWIKFYRPDETTNNTTVSYYLKGSLVALLLDLELRRRSSGKTSLDDVVRALWREYGPEGLRGKGYRDDAIQKLVEQTADFSVEEFFSRFVRGTDELELGPAFESVGLRARCPEEEEGEGSVWLGVHFAGDGDRMRITEVYEGGPALAAGLAPGDRLVAWNGWRLDDDHFKQFLKNSKPGSEVRFTFFRRDRLRELVVPLAKRPTTKVVIEPLDEASAAQRAAFQSWLADEWRKEDETEDA